ncbi:MAG: phage terminase large subunit [Chlorobiaceae bacterium]|nr:phage terminase large subunit [Chlorobiaceae bacterium]
MTTAAAQHRADIIANRRFELKKKARILEARENFSAYRRLINSKLLDGWFRQAIEADMQQFWEDFKAGQRPQLILTTPPQHGKSILIIDFISWIAGQDPSLRKIFSSFSERLGVRANLRLQRIYDSDRYREIFPDTALSGKAEAQDGKYLRNKDVLEYVGHMGYFRNTTVGGPITGESLDICIIDDPVKGREEANSPTMREKVWLWYTDDVLTRFSDNGALLMIMTRWHTDDLAGRIIETDEEVVVKAYPAIDETDTRRVSDGSLFPELKSYGFLMSRRRQMRITSWQSLYQCTPIIDEGDMFRPDNIRIIDTLPSGTRIKQRIRYWDKAGTDGGGAYTAGTQLLLTDEDTVIIVDVVRDQVSAGRREKLIKQTAEIDGTVVHIWIEQEPGSGGKESAENTIKNLIGYTAKAEPVTGSKATRAEPFAAYVEAGNVSMLKAPWNKPFLDEMRLFPNGKFKDQIDAASGAFNKLTLGKRTDGLIEWYERKAAQREAQKEAARNGAAA